MNNPERMRTGVQLARDLFNTRIKVDLKDICSKREVQLIESNPAWNTLPRCENEEGYLHVSTLCKEL